MKIKWNPSSVTPPKSKMYLVTDGRDIRTAYFDRDYAHKEFFKWESPDHVYAVYEEVPGIKLDLNITHWATFESLNLPKL